MTDSIKSTLFPQLNLFYDLVDESLLTKLQTTIETVNATTPWSNSHYLQYRGTEGSDAMAGDKNDNIIVGAGGKDYLKGKGGNDVLQGSAGSDTVLGGSGDDFLIYSASENLNGESDFYDGGRGKSDTLFVVLTYGEYQQYGWETTAFQNMLDKTAKGKSVNYTFKSFDLFVKNIENIEVIRSNAGPSAVNDEQLLKEGGFFNNLNVVANDTDTDHLDILRVLSFSDVKTKGLVTLNTNGTFNYNTNNQFNYLAAGEFVVDRFEYTVADIAGETSIAVVTMTIQGTNDLVQIRSKSDILGSVTGITGQADPITDSGVLYFSDADLSDSHDISVSPSVKALGELVAYISTDTTGTGAGGIISWYYQVHPKSIAYLSKSEQKVESFAVSIEDQQGGVVEQTITITITITGTNDIPIIAASNLVNEVHELYSFPFGNLSTTGSLSFTDADFLDTHNIHSVQASKTTLGSLTATVTSDTTRTGEGGVISWEYNVNAGDVEYLAENESKKESFFVTLDDGAGGKTVELVDVFIRGSNDNPTISSGAINSSVTELYLPYGNIRDNGVIFFNDVDLSDQHSVSISYINSTLGTLSTSISEANGQGLISLDYSVSALEVEYLAQNESKTEEFLLTLTDSAGGTVERTVTYTINGTNDNPIAQLDSISTWEDEAVTIDVLANDFDIDGDNLNILTVEDGNNGMVEIINNQLIYTPTLNFSGSDSFSYLVTDGNSIDIETVYVNVMGVVDAAELSLNLRAGETANKVIVDINSLLSDDSEILILYFEDLVTHESLLPEGVTLEGVSNGQIFNANSHEEIVLTLAEGVDHNFDFTVIAATADPRTGDLATVTKSINIELDSYEYKSLAAFNAVDQSIWNTGNEYTLYDDRFIGIDESDAAHTTGLLRANWDYDIQIGIQSDLAIEGGTLNANSVWVVDFQNDFNLSTDVLTIDTSAENTIGSFHTTGPELAYKLDFIWEVDAEFGVDLYYNYWGPGALDVDLFSISYPLNGSHESLSENIIDFDSKRGEVLTEDFGYGITGTLAWPSLDTDGRLVNGVMESSGASNNVLDINVDVDQAIAELFLADTVNPFNISADFGIAGGHLEVLDASLQAGLNFIQNFTLETGELIGNLIFEDGSEQRFVFGDELTFSSASQLDVDGDGQVEYEVELSLLDSELTNKTDIGFNAGYDLNMLAGGWWYDVAVADGSDNFDYLIDVPKVENEPIFDINLFEETFAVNFSSASVDFIV